MASFMLIFRFLNMVYLPCFFWVYCGQAGDGMAWLAKTSKCGKEVFMVRSRGSEALEITTGDGFGHRRGLRLHRARGSGRRLAAGALGRRAASTDF